MGYQLGIDIGIGSVGWAVLLDDGKETRIEDFGTRIFDSGEINDNGQKRKSQKRRGYRSVRRVERRRTERKERLKNHLVNIKLAGKSLEEELALIRDEDVFSLKVRGLSEKLTPAELARCLIHTCNHRGYRAFYGSQDSENGDDAKILETAAQTFEGEYRASGYETVSQYLMQTMRQNGFVAYRNRDGRKDELRLIRRELMEEEAEKLLRKQSEFYPCLTEKNRETTLKIIFSQRDFEDGPGSTDDPFRRYTGFLDSVGKCRYYKDEKRGHRATALGDLYAVSNALSQYRYVIAETGELVLPRALAEELLKTAMQKGELNKTELNRIAKAHGCQIVAGGDLDQKALGNAVRFLPAARKAAETAGMDWTELIGEDHLDRENPSRLNRIGAVLSENITPQRRREALKKLGFLDEKGVAAFADCQAKGMASVSDRYMADAVGAFLDGESYGNFQARFIKEREEGSTGEKHRKLTAADIADDEIRDNPVVFRAINETRKIINAVIETYGTLDSIAVEVADELNRSFQERARIAKDQRKREAENDKLREEARSLLPAGEELTGARLERYRLYKMQGGKSLYSGKDLGADAAEVMLDPNRRFEVDHIVPFSLILDNTLNNKALVTAKENQDKGQRTVLMYLSGEEKKDFIARVKAMYSGKEAVLSKRKYEYLMLPDLHDRELLNGWKSRNLNDTRYITKYIVGLLKEKLEFTTEKASSVYSVKGSQTAFFRRQWLPKDSLWAQEDKCRENYLNHALDAVIIGNLTPAYAELAAHALELRRIYGKYRSENAGEYRDYLERSVCGMVSFHHFSEEKARELLSNPKRIPSRIRNLGREIELRFDRAFLPSFEEEWRRYYQNPDTFRVPPHPPLVSMKPDRRFRGGIADDQFIRLAEIDGKKYKLKRVRITELTAKQLRLLWGADPQLRSTLAALLSGKPDDCKVGDCLSERGEKKFLTPGGQPVYKVTLRDNSPITNYYQVGEPSEGRGILGGVKYYCLEIYEDEQGNTGVRGLRYVDFVKKGGKLCIKADVRKPEGYAKHVTYLFRNEYIELADKKSGKTITKRGTGEEYKGFYQAVENINKNQISIKVQNMRDRTLCPCIGKNTEVRKYEIDILGRKGGRIRCSEPFLSIGEKS